LAEKVGVAIETIARPERASAVPSFARMEEMRSRAPVRRRAADDINLVSDIAERLFVRARKTGTLSTH